MTTKIRSARSRLLRRGRWDGEQPQLVVKLGSIQPSPRSGPVARALLQEALARPVGPAGNGGSNSLTLPCARGGSTGELSAGDYHVTPKLVAADGGVLSNAPPQNATVMAGNTTALGPVVFAASSSASTRSGFLAASLSTGPAGVPNCQGGAGMTGVALVLAHGDGSCARARFVRSRGGFLIGTYDADNCISPSLASCVDADEVVTVGDPEPGSYILRVRGKKGSLEWWTADEAFTLVPGTPLVHAFTLKLSQAPGC